MMCDRILDLEKDLQALHTENWEEIAQDWLHWRLLESEAKTHFASQS